MRCKDVPYLHAFTIVVLVNGNEGDPKKDPIYLCESCKDVKRKQYRGMWVDDPD